MIAFFVIMDNMKKILYSCCLLILSLCVASCGNDSVYSKNDYVSYMGINSNTGIKVLGLNDNELISPFNTVVYLQRFKNNRNFDDISSSLNSYYQLMHAYFDRNYNYSLNGEQINNLKVLNDSYGSGNFVEVSNELYDILKVSVELTVLSKGKFNISVGPLSDLWEECFANAAKNDYYLEKIPSKSEIDSCLKDVISYEDIKSVIEFSSDQKAVRLNRIGSYENVSLTLGAIGKGYATRVVSEYFSRVFSKEYGYLNAGESSISLITDSPFGEWSLDLSNPLYRQLKKKNLSYNNYNEYELRLIKRGRFAFSTSGNYEKFVYNDSDLYHHIIDSNTGYSCSYFDAVSVVCSNSMYADALTTALMNMDLKEGISFVESVEKEYDLEINPIWLEVDDGKVKVTADSALKDNLFVKDNEKSCTELKFIELNH